MNEKTVLVSLLFLPTKLSSLFPKRQRKSIEETRRRRIPISLFAAIFSFVFLSLLSKQTGYTRAQRVAYVVSGPLLLYTTSTDDAMITPKEPLRKALLFWNIFCGGNVLLFYPSSKGPKFTINYYILLKIKTRTELTASNAQYSTNAS